VAENEKLLAFLEDAIDPLAGAALGLDDQLEKLRHAQEEVLELQGAEFESVKKAQDQILMLLSRLLSGQLSQQDFTSTGQGRRLHLHHQVPKPHHDFKGRNLELEEMLSAVRGGANIVGIQGLGGIGKTQLAFRLIQKLRSTGVCADGDLLLDMKGDRTSPLPAGHALRHILHTLAPHQPLPENLEYLQHDYQSMLRGQRIVILLDNVASSEQVAPFNPPPDGVVVILTSRQLIQLPGYKPIVLGEMSETEAVELLLDLAPQSHVVAAQIAKRCGYLPLALRLAGNAINRRRSMRPEAYLARLDALLADPDFNDVHAAIATSYALLPEGDREPFASLSVFVSAFDVESAAAVWGLDDIQTGEILDRLALYSLVEVDDGERPYRLHDLVREFTAGVLRRNPLLAIHSRQNYVQYHQHLLERFGGYEWALEFYPRLVPYDQDLLACIDLCHEVWEQAGFRAESPAGVQSLALTSRISWYLNWRGAISQRLQICKRFTDAWELRGLADDLGYLNNAVGNLYVDQGWTYETRGQLDLALECAQRATELLDAVDREFASELEAQVLLRRGEPDAAIAIFRKLRAATDPLRRSWFVYSFRLADASLALGRHDEMTALLEELLVSLPRARLVQHEIIDDVAARIYLRWAIHCMLPADPVGARKTLERAVKLFQTSGNVTPDRIQALFELSELVVAEDPESSAHLKVEALHHATILHDHRWVGRLSGSRL
jgi:tetratricopeptide (TPR) repeat protein